MPIYEYKCLDLECNTGFTSLEKMDAPNPLCPTCGGSTRKLVSAPMVHFKGKGWYQTDFADKQPQERMSDKFAKERIVPRKHRTD